MSAWRRAGDLAWLACLAWIAAAPARADVRRTDEDIALPPYAGPCVEPGDRPSIGVVVAVTGAPTSALPGCDPRPLDCGSSVYAGDQLVTGAGDQVALESGDRYVQIGPDARVVAGTTPNGAPDLVVEQGAVRVVDTSSGQDAAPARVATRDLRTDAAGADTTAAAGEPGSSAICSYAGPVAVTPVAGGATQIAGADRGTPDVAAGPGAAAGPASGARSDPRVAAGGDCVVTGAGAPGAALPDVATGPTGSATGATAPLVSIADVGACDIAGGFEPTDVAFGPPGGPDFPFSPPPPIPPPYCQAGSCTDGPPPPGPPKHTGVPLVESPAGFEPPP